MVKDKKNALITPSERAKALQMFFKFGRNYPNLWKFVKATVSFHNFFDFQEILLKKLDFTDKDKTKDWVNVALDDLAVSRVLYKSKDGLALYHLSQGIEKLLKACLIFSGLKKESNVITMNHKPQAFAIEMLNDPDIKSAMFEKFPYKRVKKPVKPSDKKIEEFKNLIATNDKIQALNVGDEVVEGVATLIGCPSPLTYNPDQFGEFVKNMMKQIVPQKELKRFIDECNAGPVNYDDMMYNASNYCYVVINMAVFLLPLCIGTWAFQSVPRYPDELRKLGDKGFKEYYAHKAFYAILDKVEKFGECFKEYLDNI